MKFLSVLLLSLLLIGMAGSAVAKGAKNDIMHCGCIYVADSETDGVATMEWKMLTVKNGKGHTNHVVDHSDDCLSGFTEVFCTEDDVLNAVPGCETTDDVASYTPEYTTFFRAYDDCRVEGNENFLTACDDPDTGDVDETPVEGDLCGYEFD